MAGKIYMPHRKGHQLLMNNIDLNIWDQVGYETEYEQEGWVITPYTINKNGDGYGTGKQLPYDIVLSKREAERLTLGKDRVQGGDYTPDSDFWLDLHSFYVIYRDIPKRVDRALRQVLKRMEAHA
jgi:hypothetical protein